METHSKVLWITTDSQHLDTLGCLGNPHVRTPSLDRLRDRIVGTVDLQQHRRT